MKILREAPDFKNDYEMDTSGANTAKLEELKKLLNTRLSQLKTVAPKLQNIAKDFSGSGELETRAPELTGAAAACTDEIEAIEKLLKTFDAKKELTDSKLNVNPDLAKELYLLKDSLSKALKLNKEDEVKAAEKIFKEEARACNRIVDLINKFKLNDAEDEDQNENDIDWKDYLLKAKQNHNEAEAWDYYYEKVWKEDAGLIKGLGKAFRIELYVYGAKACASDDASEGNPFINYLHYLKTKLPAAYRKLNSNNYGYIHNAVVNDQLSEKDLIGIGKLRYNNVIFKGTFFSYKDMVGLLNAQGKFIHGYNSDIETSIILESIYSDYDIKTMTPADLETDLEPEIRVLIDIEGQVNKLNLNKKSSANNNAIENLLNNCQDNIDLRNWYLKFLWNLDNFQQEKLLTGNLARQVITAFKKLDSSIEGVNDVDQWLAKATKEETNRARAAKEIFKNVWPTKTIATAMRSLIAKHLVDEDEKNPLNTTGAA